MDRGRCVGWVTGLLLLAQPAFGVVVEALVATGDPVPGVPGEHFVFPGLGSVGPGGTAFSATDSRAPAVARLWLSTPEGAFVPITEAGAEAPGTGGTTFLEDFESATPWAPGFVGFRGRVAGAGVDDSNDVGVWSWRDGAGLTLLVREGDLVAGTDGARVGSIGSWVFRSDQALFANAQLVGGDASNSNDGVLLRSGPVGPEVFLREGDPAPGVPGASLGFLSSAGYEDGLLVGSFDFSRRILYFADAAGALTLIHDSSTAPPGIPDAIDGDVTFNTVQAGQVPGFVGEYRSATESGDAIWYLDENLELVLVARVPDAIGEFSLATANGPVIGGLGRVIFEGNLETEDFDVFSSILAYDPAHGELDVLARVETPVPCRPDDSFFGVFREPFTNVRGDVVFWGGIEGPGIPPASAIFARLPNGAFEVLAIRHQEIEVRPGVVKVVDTVGLANSGFRSALNDDGIVSFFLNFTDRTAALFRADLASPGDVGQLRAQGSRGVERARCRPRGVAR